MVSVSFNPFINKVEPLLTRSQMASAKVVTVLAPQYKVAGTIFGGLHDGQELSTRERMDGRDVLAQMAAELDEQIAQPLRSWRRKPKTRKVWGRTANDDLGCTA